MPVNTFRLILGGLRPVLIQSWEYVCGPEQRKLLSPGGEKKETENGIAWGWELCSQSKEES